MFGENTDYQLFVVTRNEILYFLGDSERVIQYKLESGTHSALQIVLILRRTELFFL